MPDWNSIVFGIVKTTDDCKKEVGNGWNKWNREKKSRNVENI